MVLIVPLKFEEHVRELEKEANELRQTVESLWERLEISPEEQQRILEDVESFRPKDIQIVSTTTSQPCQRQEE